MNPNTGVFLAIFLLLWFITRLREVSRNEIEYGMRSIPKVNLKAPISEAYKLYGEPNGTEVDDRNAEATNYTFTVCEHHEAVISEWKGEMHSITYWSSMSLPGPDLEAIKEHFSEGHGWNLLEKGLAASSISFAHLPPSTACLSASYVSPS